MLQSAAQLATLVSENLRLDPHEARPRTPVRSDAVDHDGMAEDHVPRLARQLGHAKGHAFDDVSLSMKAATRSAGDGACPVSAMSQG
jgi:hypothetical protein